MEITILEPHNMIIYTIGHSILSIESFIDILKHYKIDYIVDVRRWPASTRNPHFNRDDLEKSLSQEKIKYTWFGEAMGGYRKLKECGKHRVGKCLKSGGFRNYAAHMETEKFKKTLEKLIEIVKNHRTAIMCAERLYFKCHRLLISDKLKSLGIEVIHILSKDHSSSHNYSHCAKIEKGKLVYI